MFCILYKTFAVKTGINISIPKPCSEKWENFSIVPEGGFCKTCNKVVVDFTGMSQTELLVFFKTNPAYTCGRFRTDQLRIHTLEVPYQIKPGLSLFKAGFLSLLLFMVNKPIAAATAFEKNKTEINVPIYNQTILTISDEIIVKGIVVSSEDRYPLPGVNIVLKGTTIGIATDAQGRFEFPQKLKEGDVLVFSFIGLRTLEYTVRKQTGENGEIRMFKMFMDIMGEVAIQDIYETSQSGLQKIWAKIKSFF